MYFWLAFFHRMAAAKVFCRLILDGVKDSRMFVVCTSVPSF